MEEEIPHVPPLDLWGYTNGTINLTDEHLEHLLFCVECQFLVNEFIDAIDRLPPVNPGMGEAA